MDETSYEKCDPGILLWLAQQMSEDDFRFPTGHKSRHDYEILAGLVISEEIKRRFGSDPSAVVAALREKDIDIKPAQIRNYFKGRFTPGAGLVGRIANDFSLPEIRRLSQMPWRLLTDQTLSLTEIKKTRLLRSDVALRPSRIQDGIITVFNPKETWLNTPADPEEFWQSLAAYRAALAMNDYYSANAQYWRVIANLPSLAIRDAVVPHVERLYGCVRILTKGIDPKFLWFSVNWNTIREAIEHHEFGPTSRCKPFRNIFRGNDMHLGRAFPITKLHRYLDAHPEVVRTARRAFASLRTKAT